MTMLKRRWRACEDDAVGGWCIALESDTRTPGEGAFTVGNFMSRETAQHIAELHNVSLLTETERRSARLREYTETLEWVLEPENLRVMDALYPALMRRFRDTVERWIGTRERLP